MATILTTDGAHWVRKNLEKHTRVTALLAYGKSIL